jgi:hypothetical protein
MTWRPERSAVGPTSTRPRRGIPTHRQPTPTPAAVLRRARLRRTTRRRDHPAVHRHRGSRLRGRRHPAPRRPRLGRQVVVVLGKGRRQRAVPSVARPPSPWTTTFASTPAILSPISPTCGLAPAGYDSVRSVPGGRRPRRIRRAPPPAPPPVPAPLRRLLAVGRRQRRRPDVPGWLEVSPDGRPLRQVQRRTPRPRSPPPHVVWAT